MKEGSFLHKLRSAYVDIVPSMSVPNIRATELRNLIPEDHDFYSPLNPFQNQVDITSEERTWDYSRQRTSSAVDTPAPRKSSKAKRQSYQSSSSSNSHYSSDSNASSPPRIPPPRTPGNLY